MGFAQIEFDTTSAKIRSGDAVIDCYLFREDADALSAIDEDTVAREELLRFIEVDHHFVKELAALLGPARRQIARETSNSRVSGREAGSGERFDQIINFFPLGEGVEEDGHGA